MWTNLLASTTALLVVLLWTFLCQFHIAHSTDRTDLERLLQVNPCMMRSAALEQLGRVCLQRSRAAEQRSDFQEAAEPLYFLIKRPVQEQKTGYEPEAARRIRLLPMHELDVAQQRLTQHRYADARKLFEEIPKLYLDADPELMANATMGSARSRLLETEELIHHGWFDDALDSAMVLCTEKIPAAIRDQARGLIPQLAAVAVDQRLLRGQIQEALDFIGKAREAVRSRPDLSSRVEVLKDRVGKQLFGEASDLNAPPIPVPGFSAPLASDSPKNAVLTVGNNTPYTLRIVAAASGRNDYRWATSLKPGTRGRFVLPPGRYWEKASLSAPPANQSYFGGIDLDTGMYRQDFTR